MTSLKNRLAIFVASSVLWQAMKYFILENLSITTNIKSLHFIGLRRPKIKSIEISTLGSLGTGKGVYNP
jgi:hypothetical protein